MIAVVDMQGSRDNRAVGACIEAACLHGIMGSDYRGTIGEGEVLSGAGG